MSQFGYSIGNYPNNGLAVKSYMTDARENAVSAETQVDAFASHIKTEDAGFPYSSKAKDGIIEYNGVVFVGDSKSNSLNLGDMTDKNRVMHIQLSGGGFLNVNYDNIGDLKDAMGMFSGKDQGIILKAISTYHFEKGFVKAAEDEEEETVKKLSGESSSSGAELAEATSEPQSEAEIAMEKLKYNGLSLYDKLIANSDDNKIRVGPSKIEVPKWDPE